MARRRASTKRRSSSGGTKAKGSGTQKDGVSFKSKGQTENGSSKARKENRDPMDPPSSGEPQGKFSPGASPLHRASLLNNLISSSGRDSACSSDDAPVSSYTSSSSTPSCGTPSLGSSYDSSRTGTPSMQTPSIRTPSMRTPSLFSQSFENSSFDASSLDDESHYDSSTCGTPVTPGSRHPLLLDVSSSQEESSEESRAKKKTEKRKRYRRNRRLRMLAALHMENLEKAKALEKCPEAEKNDIGDVQSSKGIIIEEMDDVKESEKSENGTVANSLMTGSDNETNGENSNPRPLMTVKENENSDEIVDEGFSEHFDKAQRKDLEETIVITNESTASEDVKEVKNKDMSVNVISIELEGEIRYEGGSGSEKEKSLRSKYNEGLSETLKSEMDKITSEVLETRFLNEKNGVETKGVNVNVNGVSSNVQSQTEGEEACEGDDGKGQGNDNPPKEAEGQGDSPAESNSGESAEEESVGTPSKEDTLSSASSPQPGNQIPDETDTTSKDESLKDTDEVKEQQHPSSREEVIETVQCTKAKSDEVSSAIINDNLQLINPNHKLELVDVIETKGCTEDLVVFEMKNQNDVSKRQENNNEEEGKTVGDELMKPKVRFAEGDDDENEQVVDIPIIVESGYEEIFPEEHVEVVDVMKGEGDDEEDIMIFEVKDPNETIEEGDENEEEEEEEEEKKENEKNKEIVVNKEESNGVQATSPKEESEPSKKIVDAKDKPSETSGGAHGTVNRDAAKKPAGKVDAALAELDSIPDGVCESGEVEEEEEDEEEWSYYRMEPQTQPQGEDVLVGGVPPAVVAPTPSEDFEILSEPSDMVHDQDIVSVPQDNAKETTQDQALGQFDEQNEDFIDNLSERVPKNELLESFEEKKDLCSSMEADESPLVVGKTPDYLESNMDMIPSLDDHPERLINFSGPGMDKMENLMETSMHESMLEPSSPHGSGSPRMPGSPRSVEGFVTSVELNTPDESFATNFAVNQAQDAFAAVVDQTSGPFSVYVSSSPEPASLDPPMQSNVDLLNMSGGMTNGQVDEEHASMNQTPELHEEVSPVEIVHAQSTVEVVAPPSPVDVSGPETQFIIPEYEAPESPTSGHMHPSDISFVPQPIMEPTAEVPVPVYVDDTPVSETDLISDVNESVSAVDMVNVSQTAEDFMSETKMQMDVLESASSKVESFVETSQTEISDKVESFVETSQTEISDKVESFVESSQTEISDKVESSQTEISDKVESFVETSQTEISESFSHMESKSEMVSSHIEAETFSQVESATEAMSLMESELETKQNELSQISSPVPALSQVETTPVSPVQSSPLPADIETVPQTAAVSDVTSAPVDTVVVSAPVIDIPEEASKSVKSPEAKTPAKGKTPAKPATDKAPAKTTTGKATPGKATPGKATPTRTPATRTPSTKTPTTRTPVTKSTEKRTPTTKPSTPGTATRITAAKPSTTRPASAKPAPEKPAAAKPATTRLAPRPAPTRTPATTRSPMSASKPAEKPKSTGPAAPKAGTTARPTRPTPTARTTTTTTRKPLDTAKSADKTDGSKLVNGTTSRPSSRPGTARSTTTAPRKPLSSTTRTATKPAGEKDTKNTTNQILSTRPSKPASATTKATATKMSTAHSTSRTASRVTESTNAAKSRMTNTTKSTATRTTGAATKKTLVSKSKTQAGTKETSVKTKTEAAVIDKTELLVNGENKIADEETSVEVIEKCAVEDIMQASNEKVLTETMTSSEQVVVTTETTEVLVNGDH